MLISARVHIFVKTPFEHNRLTQQRWFVFEAGSKKYDSLTGDIFKTQQLWSILEQFILMFSQLSSIRSSLCYYNKIYLLVHKFGSICLAHSWVEYVFYINNMTGLWPNRLSPLYQTIQLAIEFWFTRDNEWIVSYRSFTCNQNDSYTR